MRRNRFDFAGKLASPNWFIANAPMTNDGAESLDRADGAVQRIPPLLPLASLLFGMIASLQVGLPESGEIRKRLRNWYCTPKGALPAAPDPGAVDKDPAPEWGAGALSHRCGSLHKGAEMEVRVDQ